MTDGTVAQTTRPSAAAAAADPLRRTTLGDQIKDHLLARILEGDLPPGSPVVETQIARELGVSQGPVREALRDLAMLGVVDLQPHRSARVRAPSPTEHVEAMRVRTELEAMAAREAAGRLTAADEAELRRLTEEMARLSAAGDVAGHAADNTRFHAVIVRASANRTLERLWWMLQPLAQTYLTAAITGLAPAERYVDTHAPILRALLAGDPDGAEEAVRAHGHANVEMVIGARHERRHSA